MHVFFDALEKYSNDATADGIAVLSDAVRTTSRFSSLNDAINNFVADVTDTSAYSDVNARLAATCGIVLGADNDFTADTGAISGYNAGGTTVKDAQSIVPETSNLDTVDLPAAGSTTTHTYTGDDGKVFTFYVKWPSSFTKFYDLSGVEYSDWMKMSATERESYYRELTSTETVERDNEEDLVSGAQIISGMETVLKGMYNFWLSEASKLAYDSYGVDFDGKTIRVQFAGCGWASQMAADTEWGYENFTEYTLPADEITLTINAVDFAVIDPADPNGNTHIEGGVDATYLDRIIAHEMVHGVMFGKGLVKYTSPEFFTEGIAELVHGEDDYDGKGSSYIRNLAESNASLSSAMSLEPGTGTSARYIAGYMFLHYLAQQSLNTNIQVGNSSDAVTFSFDGNDAIISNYKSADKINYSANYTGLTLSGDDLILNSSTGSAYIRDCRDRLINVADSNGDIAAYGYLSSTEGFLDGSAYDKTEVIIGANEQSNIITAGSAGSSLWGGTGGADTLIGGAGVDEFFYATGNGTDVILNAASNDIVNLLGVSLEQIASAEITDSGVNATFTDGGTLQVVGQAGSFVAGGQTYHADYQNKTWLS